MMASAVRPYVMDLGSVNGTFINNERIESERYYELLEQVRFCRVKGRSAQSNVVKRTLTLHNFYWDMLYMASVWRANDTTSSRSTPMCVASYIRKLFGWCLLPLFRNAIRYYMGST